MKKKLSLLASALISAGAFCQTVASTQSHEGAVNQLFPFETASSQSDAFLSAGNDGFIIKWSADGMGDHYQVSNLQIKLVARSPATGDIAVYETDGSATHRVTVMDPSSYAKKFSRKFTSPVSSLSFSAKGRYLFAGTAAVNGLFILNAHTGTIIKKAADVSGIVTMAMTGDSEKTALLYSQSGTISYFDLAGMKLKAKFAAAGSLEQAIIFGSGKFANRFLAGVRGGMIYIIDATSGKTLGQYPASSPLIFASRAGHDEKQGLYFITDDGRTYSLRLIDEQMLQKLVTGGFAAAPLIIKNFTGLDSRDKFTCAAKNSSTVMLGSRSGNIYTMTDIPESELYSLFAITENMYEKVLDIAAFGGSYYVLAGNAVFKTSYDSKAMTRLCPGFSQKNLLMCEDGSMLLWSRNSEKPVQLVPPEGADSPRTLFTPESQLQSLRVSGSTIIYVLGASDVITYDINTGSSRTLYSGTSVQDAVIADESTAIVAKTKTGSTDSALVSVNIQTQETVPLKFTGNVAFSLSLGGPQKNDALYGISISTANGSPRTQAFSYMIKSGIQSTLFSLQAEDSGAFTAADYPFVFTNIGKNQVRANNISTKRSTVFRRSASMPLKAVPSGNRLAVLNYNGSISWYNPNSQALLADWYLTADGQWFEF
ncbi:MAG: hypothetical protein J6K96_07935 [Treponema sp.]|nr:hypothetical protein [Treponema sp.]